MFSYNNISIIKLNQFIIIIFAMRKIIQSISDKRIFKPLELQNNLSCLIISDKDANKSSASLSVGVGSFLDPMDAQGLAHYLQHMLFMGTNKYPQENQYSNFLSKNAGSSNAYTSLDETNFFFQVQNNAFHDTLDRFSRFFIDPLMLDSSSERQLNAVHSQHSKNLQNDSWRKYQLSKHLSKANHPYHKFSTGDKSTLSNPNLRQMLFNFYNSQYSSNLMKLVVYGRDDVQILSRFVQQKFREVKDYRFSKFQLGEHPYNENTIGKFIKIVPVKDRRVLDLSWVVNNYGSSYKYSPAKYVSYILGNEGKGSLLSFLIAEGLATSLSAGGADSFDCYSEFEVSVSLTDKGVQNINEVIRYVLYFIKMLKGKQPERWIFQEIQRINKMKFDFLQKKQGMNFTSHVARNMHKRSLQEIFVHSYLMQEFRPDLIKQYLNELNVNNLMIMAESKSFEAQCKQTQPIYGTRYTIQKIDNISQLPCNLLIPEKNAFIPDDLTILPLGNQLYPRKIYESKFMEAFFKSDHQFELPKAQLHLRLYFGGQNSAQEDVVRSLFQKMLQQKLRQFVYMADQAQLQSSVSFSSYYIVNIDIGGFRDSLNRFITKYFNEILQFKPRDRELFLNLKEKQKKEYENYFLNSPYQIAYNTIMNALREGNSNSPLDKLKQLEKVQLEDLVRYSDMWKKTLFGQFLMTGNIMEDQVYQISKSIEGFLSKYSIPLQKSKIGTVRPIFLPLNQVCAVEEVLKSQQQTNSSLIVHYQHESSNLMSDLYQELAYYIVKQPAFDFLRTKEQLGYIVMCLQDDHRGVSGMSILVQSNIKTTYELQKYVQKFINEILKEIINTLDEKAFNQYKNALHSTKIQKDKSLSSQTGRFWGQIVRHSYLFTRKQESAKVLPDITLAQFKAFFNSLFYDNKRIFEMHQIAQQTVEKNNSLRQERMTNEPHYKVFSDVESFRKKMPLYPDYYAHL